MLNNCIFCAIAAGEIPCRRIYEDDETIAFLDINPCSEGHTLVIPKRHWRDLTDAPDEAVAAVMARVRKIAAHLREALPCDGFNILQNNGAAAGQSVGHLHFHIVPRRQGGESLSFVSREGDTEQLAALQARLAMV